MMRVFCIDLILCGAREGAIGFDLPEPIVIEFVIGGAVDGLLEFVGILSDAATTIVFEVHDIG